MADDDIREGDPDRVRKKKAPPPDDDADDAPRKKKKVAQDDDDDNDLGNSPLSAIVPVGGSIWAVLSLYSALLCFIPGLSLLAILFGVLALVTHKHKASYGSITGNMRAILGIVIGFIVLVGWGIGLFVYLSNPRAFR
ncbi:MAG: hypothetical protein HYX68_04195 [Planctomycetes bacterium]|jgi:hypothetical protein|nr:hypothetical protein [Planctomycetota bacterium]